MMKKLSGALVICLMVILAACSGTPAYSPEKVKELAEKCQSGAELSQSDYSEMIGQMDAILTELAARQNEIDKLPADQQAEANAKLAEDTAFVEMAGSFMGLGMYLGINESKLDDSNKKKLEALQERAKSLK